MFLPFHLALKDLLSCTNIIEKHVVRCTFSSFGTGKKPPSAYLFSILLLMPQRKLAHTTGIRAFCFCFEHVVFVCTVADNNALLKFNMVLFMFVYLYYTEAVSSQSAYTLY